MKKREQAPIRIILLYIVSYIFNPKITYKRFIAEREIEKRREEEKKQKAYPEPYSGEPLGI